MEWFIEEKEKLGEKMAEETIKKIQKMLPKEIRVISEILRNPEKYGVRFNFEAKDKEGHKIAKTDDWDDFVDTVFEWLERE